MVWGTDESGRSVKVKLVALVLHVVDGVGEVLVCVTSTDRLRMELDSKKSRSVLWNPRACCGAWWVACVCTFAGDGNRGGGTGMQRGGTSSVCGCECVYESGCVCWPSALETIRGRETVARHR